MSGDFETDLLTGLAELLAAAGVGNWSPSGVAPAGLPTITLRVTPPTPDEVITLTAYTAESNTRLTDSITAVNVRIRGTRDPGSASLTSSLVHRTLHALGRATLGTTPNQLLVSDVQFRSATLIGPDGSGRQVRSENYYVLHNRPHPRLD